MSDLRGFISTPLVYDPQALREEAMHRFTLMSGVFVLIPIRIKYDSLVVSNGVGVYRASTGDYSRSSFE
jgi:hypothetical protein